MKIIVTKANEVVYQQTAEDPAVMNKVVGHLMSQPAGTTYVTTVTNNGNDLTFRSTDVDIGTLVRLVNNIAMRTRGDKQEV